MIQQIFTSGKNLVVLFLNYDKNELLFRHRYALFIFHKYSLNKHIQKVEYNIIILYINFLHFKNI